MINITDKHNCCGCSACIQICSNQCISFDEDEQGFCYPLVNKKLCIDCGLCEKVCPSINQDEQNKPLRVFAAINPNEEIRMKSSSGGIFTMLAEAIIDEGGVVFGARFDENWEVRHDYTETKEGLEAFRGSKYVQSLIGETYRQALEYLKRGRKVLFSGTSCQIAALNKYLRIEYDNLLAVDVVCHGVPSPLVWREYLKEVNPSKKKISYINLRDKSRGWARYSYVIKSQNSTLYDDYAANSLYLQGFTWNFYLRPSCYKCPAKNGKSKSDITLADNWGYVNTCPEMFDNKGLSTIVVNTQKGEEFLAAIVPDNKEIDPESIYKYNASFCTSSPKSKYYNMFWLNFPIQGLNAINTIKLKMRPNIVRRIISKIKQIITQ